VGLSINIRN